LSTGTSGAYWRVGYHADPCGFVPEDLYSWKYRFDDINRGFRAIYVGEFAETIEPCCTPRLWCNAQA
jgi:hypothetical protein